MEVLPERRTESPPTPPTSSDTVSDASDPPIQKRPKSPQFLTLSLEMAQHAARNAGVTDPLVLPARITKLTNAASTSPTDLAADAISSRMRVSQPAKEASDDKADKGVSLKATNQRHPTQSDPNPDHSNAPAQAGVPSPPSTNQMQAKSTLSSTSSELPPNMEDPSAASKPRHNTMDEPDTPNSSLGPSPSDSARHMNTTSPATSETESMFAKREISQVSQTHQPMSAFSSFSSRASLCRHARHATEPPPHNHSRASAGGRDASNLDPSVLGTSCNNCTCPSPPSSPPLQPNDRARIRTPASAVSSRRNSIVIGERIPFEAMTSSAAPSRGSPADSVLPRVNHQRAGLNYAPARLQLPPEIDHTHTQHQSAPPTANNSPPHTPRSRCGSTTSLHLHRDEHRRTMRPIIDDLSMAAPDRAVTPPIKQLRGRKAPLYIPAVLRPTDANSYTAANSPSFARRAGQSVQPPPRDHWVPDSARDCCAACMAPFTLLGRRHHCRKCGDIFCSRDSRYVVALNQSLQFNLFGYPSRACANCSTAFTKHVLESSRFTSEPTQPSLPQGTQAIAANRTSRQENNEILAGSLANMPVDWNWSTF